MSVVNPAQIKSFGGTQLKRAKTDKADAKLIAQFCQQMNPVPWTPAVVRLSIATVLATIKTEIKTVEAMIHDHIDRHLDLKDQAKLLESIPGIGQATIYRLQGIGVYRGCATLRSCQGAGGVCWTESNRAPIRELGQRQTTSFQKRKLGDQESVVYAGHRGQTL